MLIAGQGVADQDCVAPILVQCAIGLVGDLEWRQHRARVKLQGIVRAEMRNLAGRKIRLIDVGFALIHRVGTFDIGRRYGHLGP
ncbi:hypothetical protein GCM10010136_26950 [Limoniibacter endophyticus]|uniref:Uncharacterized protein n=1 Tax=Limoniibacter endophyticus TaxID=1565040 RepID=A0A8J3DQB0_9HYPH|nr:hypothetical protein GCM10010136_26950 [Limoniibacter endophyticus]